MLKTPQGTESIFLKEAFLHKQVTYKIEKLFSSWGYPPSLTPVFDFYDIYRPLLKDVPSEKIYRLIDREGDLLMLRSDITLFLAKQLGPVLKSLKTPVRVCYADSILRHQDKEDISRNEFFQTGAELFGKPGIEGDLEIFMLLIETLDLLSLPGTRIHVGSRELFNSVYSDYTDKEKGDLLNSIIKRDWELLKEKSFRHSKDDLETLINIFSFIGSCDDFAVFAEKTSGFSAMESAVNYLKELVSNIRKLNVPDIVRIDLSEIGTQPYHTGIAFQVYMEGTDSAVISGGRYDNLMQQFGGNASSVGFSLLLRKVEPFIGNRERFVFPEAVETASGKDFTEKYMNAKKIRENGGISLL
jgi:ATP phosphoribosyltransferase regulatory subunit